MTTGSLANASVIRAQAPIKPRKLGNVPFVELYGGRVQGVVSASSDPNRVYVCFVEAGSTNFSCSTNNNRACNGIYSRGCKHITKMLEEAGIQFGVERVARYLEVQGDIPASASPKTLASYIKGSYLGIQAGMGFARFLSYLRYVELPATCDPIPEMCWFTG